MDTNVLVYAEGVQDLAREKRARTVLKSLLDHQGFVAVQTLGEIFRVLTRKFRFPASEAQRSVAAWREAFIAVPTSEAVLEAALELCLAHRYDIRDAIILAAAAESRCDMLLSEDGHSGFTWRGVAVVDPFAGELHPLAVHLLKPR